jgi:hypothetical protein
MFFSLLRGVAPVSPEGAAPTSDPGELLRQRRVDDKRPILQNPADLVRNRDFSACRSAVL